MKLTLMKGLPGSGKSTIAREMVRGGGSVGRVNRDDLREMLFDSVWTGKREGVVVDCEKAIAQVLFDHGMNVIVDDTNLSPRHRDLWSDVAKSRGQNFAVNDLTKLVDIATCIDRDSKRAKGVGRPVIERLALQNGLIDWGDKPIVIVDIDGTIADGSHRHHLVTGEKKDWKAYFELCGGDAPYEHILAQVAELHKDHLICMVSGRPDTYWSLTSIWMNHQSALGLWTGYDHIFMRAGGDKRPDTDVKSDILKYMPKEKIVLVIDDRPSVCRMWEEHGLNVQWARGRDLEDF